MGEQAEARRRKAAECERAAVLATDPARGLPIVILPVSGAKWPNKSFAALRGAQPQPAATASTRGEAVGGLRYANPPCDCAFGADGNGELEVPMARYLKRGMDASAIKAADAKVRETGRGRPRASRDRARRGGARAVAECRTIQSSRRGRVYGPM